ncbi:hypothetical protein NP493_22g07002 [Ridgeia piscesae]|uniref:Uncharacterized protein n=1 Tax=Ridgeia piscesae TaxID=27915 RepID=A0AAD9PE16_RIDPI|nr:hypothetical protein NP493_22g07002 [Ridgeia piscesae]
MQFTRCVYGTPPIRFVPSVEFRNRKSTVVIIPGCCRLNQQKQKSLTHRVNSTTQDNRCTQSCKYILHLSFVLLYLQTHLIMQRSAAQSVRSFDSVITTK